MATAILREKELRLVVAGVCFGVFGQAIYDVSRWIITSIFPSFPLPYADGVGAFLAVFVVFIAWRVAKCLDSFLSS